MSAPLAFNGARQWRKNARKRFAPLLKAPKEKSMSAHGCAIKRQWRALMAQTDAVRRLISRFQALTATRRITRMTGCVLPEMEAQP